MKRLFNLLLTLFLVLCLVGCSSSSNQNTTPTQEPTTTETASDDSTSSDTSHKILVAYYSASGSTEKVAQTIADTLNADLFEITPTEVYTSDDLNWTNDNSRVTLEHNDESLRDVPLTQVTPDNFDEYDVVFIGYPIWWGIAAWPVNNFVSGNDFTNKTVIPFCTSASSGIGQSGTLLEELAGSGDWMDGERFSSNASSSNVETWTNSLGLD